MPFKEGSEVKTGDLLFEIDPRPYQAQYDQAVSQVTLYEAQLDLARKTYARFETLDKTLPGAVSKLLLDQYQEAVVVGEAKLAQSKKSLEVYQLNKDFTRVTSPIDGQVSRYYFTLHNLVNQDQTLLTTVVSLDPIYVYFDMDEPTLKRFNITINEGRMALPEAGTIPVFMETTGEEDFPHQGKIDFINNQVNPNTGSISVRGIFNNPKPPGGPLSLAVMTVGCLASPLRAPLVALPPPVPAYQPACGCCRRGISSHPAADRSTLSCPTDHRPGRPVGPGPEVRLRRRCREQGFDLPHHDRSAARRRPARRLERTGA